MNLIIDYGGGQSVTIPRVQWSDTLTLDYGLVTKMSRGGTQHQFKRNNYPQLETRYYAFSAVRLATIDQLRTLLANHLGEIATITAGVSTFQSVIYSDVVEIITVKDNCAYDFDLELLVIPAYDPDCLLLEDGDNLLLEDGFNILLEST